MTFVLSLGGHGKPETGSDSILISAEEEEPLIKMGQKRHPGRDMDTGHHTKNHLENQLPSEGLENLPHC